MTGSNVVKLLLVEDEVLVALDLKARLEDMGYAVVGQAADGHEAMAAAIETMPDLVLMDITLRSGPDGIDTARRVRAELQRPVVFLTAHSDDATLRRAGLTGPFGYVIKPVHDRELQIAIEMALYQHRAEAQLRQVIEELRTAMSNIKTLTGLLPICMHCKKIRDEAGYWKAVEQYVSAHTDARFSHGICEACLMVHYPDFAKPD